MSNTDRWREIVASALDWDQARVTLEKSVADLAPELRGRRPDRFPHSIWQLLDHIRRTQHDLLDFCVNDQYAEPHWPDDYWSSAPAPPNDAAWNECLRAIHGDREGLKKLATDPGRDLTAKIPHGTGQTYLRTILVAVDHASYHVGQIIAVRRLLGAW